MSGELDNYYLYQLVLGDQLRGGFYLTFYLTFAPKYLPKYCIVLVPMEYLVGCRLRLVSDQSIMKKLQIDVLI